MPLPSDPGSGNFGACVEYMHNGPTAGSARQTNRGLGPSNELRSPVQDGKRDPVSAAHDTGER